MSLALEKFRSEHPNTDPVASLPSGADTTLAGSGSTPEQAFCQHKQRLLSALNHAEGAPFTLQRLCELIVAPSESYSHVNKLVFGLEKLLSVSTIIDTAGPEVAMPSEAVTKIKLEETQGEMETAKAANNDHAPNINMEVNQTHPSNASQHKTTKLAKPDSEDDSVNSVMDHSTSI